MKKMGLWAKRIASVGLSLALIFGASNLGLLSQKDLETVQAASAVTRQSIHDGAILHAFCWNFNTIKDNMPEIAAAGYTAIQTSPINSCLSTEPGLTLYSDTGKWYYHYQPTDWVIGNYQLGTRDEFKAMCDEADKYGIGVIVDIDPNHTTPLFDQLGDGLLQAVDGKENLYHINGDDVSRQMNYSDRVSTTYDPMGGLPDVDTENEAFQQYFYEFLKDCVACGADGFRVDTAKHIALPDDGVPSDYAGQEDRNDFYPNMKTYLDENAAKDYDDLFVYGEVLQGDTARLAAYQDMLGGTTASDYGGAIRTAISSGSLAASKIQGYKIYDDEKNGVTYKADSDKLVTWVESHDNYINDKSYKTVDDTDVILAWAIIAAREDGTPLFFSRPNGSSAENIWGDNVLGAAGSDIYKAPIVAAANKFRTAMVGEPETLRNANGNNSVLMIERGDKGVVIVNDSESDIDIDTETGIADGTYLDSVEGSDALFNVKDGVITGTVKAKSAVVLDKTADGDYSTLFFFNSKSWGKVSAVVDGVTYDCRNTGDGWWTVTIPAKEFEVVFTDGVNDSSKFNITESSGRYMTGEDGRIFNTKAEAEEAAGIITKSVYFFNTVDWSTVYAYAWTDSVQYFGGWPGVAAKNEGGYWWRADVKMMSDKSFSIIFNNNNGSQTENIDMTDASKCYVVLSQNQPGGNLKTEQYSSKEEAMDAIGIYGDKTTVHFYNTRGWKQVGVYTWGAISLGEWPGTAAEYEGNNWWKLTINAAPSADLNIIFNDMNNGNQTGDLVLDSISNVYFWGDNKYSSKAAAEQAAYDYEHADAEEIQKKDGCELVYFNNEKLWNSVYVYAWGGDYNNCIGEWPGTKMTRVDGSWYAANVPKEALENADLHLIFNNGNGTQLKDNVVHGTSTLYFTASSTSSFASKEDVNTFLNKEEEPEEPEQPEEPETPSEYKPVDETPSVADGYTRVYYKLDSTWKNEVSTYGWLKKADGSSAGQIAEWPGVKTYHIGNGWHAFDLQNEYLINISPAKSNAETTNDTSDDAKTHEDLEATEDTEDTDDAEATENTEDTGDTGATEDTENTEDTSEPEDEDGLLDMIARFFNPMPTVSAAEIDEDVPQLTLIAYDVVTGQQTDVDMSTVTTSRPSDTELGKNTTPEPTTPDEPEAPVQPIVTPSQPSVSGSSSQVVAFVPSTSSSNKGTAKLQVPSTASVEAQDTETQNTEIKSADTNGAKTKKAQPKKAETKTTEVVAMTSPEDKDEVEEKEEPAQTEVASKEVVGIENDNTPAAGEKKSSPVVPIAAVAIVLVAVGGAAITLKRKTK